MVSHNSAIMLNYFSWTSSTSIAKSKQESIIKVTTPLCFGAAVVERAPCRCQDRRVAHQLPQETQDSLVRSSPGLCIASTSPPCHLLYVVRPGT
jgi:hypothetical protein